MFSRNNGSPWPVGGIVIEHELHHIFLLKLVVLLGKQHMLVNASLRFLGKRWPSKSERGRSH